MSEDLKKIREALNHNVGHSRLYLDNESFESAKEALQLFDAHVAATSQQEAQPVASAQNEIEAVTKAVLFADCGNTEDWKENLELGKAAVKAHRPFVTFWRNEALDAAARIVERYAPDSPEITHAVNNILALKNSDFIMPVASVPQDVEEWISENAINTGMVHGYAVPIYKLRTFLSQREAGSVRVPVDFIDILRDAPELNTSNYDHDQVCRLNAAVIDAFSVLTASKEGV